MSIAQTLLQKRERGETGPRRPHNRELARFSRAKNRLCGLAISSGQRVPPDDRKFLQHLQAVPQITHSGALVVCPAYRHLDHTKSPLDGNKQNFGVESPALDGLKLEHCLRRRPRKSLESTLRIGERQP